MNKFANISKVRGMTTDKLMKPNYEIIYKRITQQTGVHTMNLILFFSALELISQTIYPEEEEHRRVEVLMEHLLQNF